MMQTYKTACMSAKQEAMTYEEKGVMYEQATEEPESNRETLTGARKTWDTGLELQKMTKANAPHKRQIGRQKEHHQRQKENESAAHEHQSNACR